VNISHPVDPPASMPITGQGDGPLFVSPNTVSQREQTRSRKRSGSDKRMSVSDAVTRFVHSGDYLAAGGFGTNRIATAFLHEIVRRKDIDHLGFAGHTTTHDFQIMAAGHQDGRVLMDRIDVAYIVGLEARGLSKQARNIMKSPDMSVCEWTNYTLALRFKAAAMGASFLPCKSMLGTDTFAKSAALQSQCPFTGDTVVLIPALSPDVAVIHVHEADAAGNAAIHGITVADQDLAKAAKHVVLTTERLVDNSHFRNNPEQTYISGIYVDAVCEVPFGSYPGNMYGEYFSDEDHLKHWLSVEKDPATFAEFLDQHLFNVETHEAYLEQCGGQARLKQLSDIERNKGGE